MNKSASITILQNDQGAIEEITDEVTIEEPLEFSIAFGPQSSRQTKNIAITMRTPGNDFELVLGFLYSEGIIKNKNDVQTIARVENFGRSKQY